MRSRTWLAVATFCGLVSGCDSTPSGPGVLTAVVEGTRAAAVVLEIAGDGVEGFVEEGSTQLFGGDELAEGRRRVVLVGDGSAPLTVGVRVIDLGLEAPRVVVVSAADGDNAPVPPGSLKVRIGLSGR